MMVSSVKRARLPLSYDTGLGRGGKPPLSTPTAKVERDARIIFRCSVHEKIELLSKAEYAGVTTSQLMREALGLVETKRRRTIPRTDPALVREVGRIGSNLNQITRWLNSSVVAGYAHEVDALVVAGRLVAIERALSLLTTPHPLACLQAYSAECTVTQLDERQNMGSTGVRS
jgi:hypothetical protein